MECGDSLGLKPDPALFSGVEQGGQLRPDGGQGSHLGRPPGRRNLWPSLAIALAFGASAQLLLLRVLRGSLLDDCIVIYVFCEGWRLDLCC